MAKNAKKVEEKQPEELQALEAVGFSTEEAQNIFGNLVTIAGSDFDADNRTTLLEEELQGHTDEQNAVISKIYADLEGIEPAEESTPQDQRESEEHEESSGAEGGASSGEHAPESTEAPEDPSIPAPETVAPTEPAPAEPEAPQEAPASQSLEGYDPWTGPCTLPDGTTCRDHGCWDYAYVTNAITGLKDKVKVSNCKNKG